MKHFKLKGFSLLPKACQNKCVTVRQKGNKGKPMEIVSITLKPSTANGTTVDEELKKNLP